MADDQSSRRRGRGADAEARAGALERLKALRRDGRRSDTNQIKVADPIYDTVDEDEYESLVAKRRQEAEEFVVDDDGLGYLDEGQEEDWSKACGPMSSEESEGEEKPKRKKAEKKDVEKAKKPSSLSAAAALMGKQRLSNMFTSSVFKKREEKGMSLLSDSVIDHVLAEFAPDEGDRERRRKQHSNLVKCMNPISSITKVKSENLGINGSDSRLRSGISFDVGSNCENLGNNLSKGDVCGGDNLRRVSDEVKDMDAEMSDNLSVGMSDSLMKESVVEESLLNNSEVKREVEVKKEYVLNAKVNNEEKDRAFSATAGWQAVRAAGNGSVAEINHSSSCDEKHEFEVESDGSLPFYLLDAHEEFYGVNAGNIYLFGKVLVVCHLFISLQISLS